MWKSFFDRNFMFDIICFIGGNMKNIFLLKLGFVIKTQTEEPPTFGGSSV